MRRLTDGRVSVQQNGCSTLSPDAHIKNIVKAISKEAVFLGLNLPANIVAEIDAFARSEPLHANYDPHGPTFQYADVQDPRRKISSDRWHSRTDPMPCRAGRRE
jgi:hypothetical protein